MLVRWRPRWGLASRPDEFDRLVGSFFDDAFRSWYQSGGEERAWSPSVDVLEENNHYELRAELPGIKKEDVEVFVDEGELVLRGERKWQDEEKKDNYRRIERRFGKFERRFGLPENVKPEDVKAEYKDGVLSIVVPKAELPKPKQIAVEIK
jgi:HSP20 family protein